MGVGESNKDGSEGRQNEVREGDGGRVVGNILDGN